MANLNQLKTSILNGTYTKDLSDLCYIDLVGDFKTKVEIIDSRLKSFVSTLVETHIHGTVEEMFSANGIRQEWLLKRLMSSKLTINNIESLEYSVLVVLVQTYILSNSSETSEYRNLFHGLYMESIHGNLLPISRPIIREELEVRKKNIDVCIENLYGSIKSLEVFNTSPDLVSESNPDKYAILDEMKENLKKQFLEVVADSIGGGRKTSLYKRWFTPRILTLLEEGEKLYIECKFIDHLLGVADKYNDVCIQDDIRWKQIAKSYVLPDGSMVDYYGVGYLRSHYKALDECLRNIINSAVLLINKDNFDHMMKTRKPKE